MSGAVRWAPAVVLALGAVLVLGMSEQRSAALRADLGGSVPERIDGYVARDLEITEAERRVAGMTDYLMRVYEAPGAGASAAGAAAFSLYVGYYDSQTQGKTIHSPRNCLPGAGWEPLRSERTTVAGPDGPVPVNRFLIQNGEQRALVLYWYQGRGRVAADEYAVKWDLLRDAALRGRSEEALVRVLVPVRGSEEEALRLAERVAARVLPSVDRALPTFS